MIPTEGDSSIIEVGGTVWKSKEAPKLLLKLRKAPQVLRQNLYLYLILTKTITFCRQMEGLGQMLLSPSPSMELGLLNSSVHIACSLQYLQDVAAALGTHKNLYSTAWYFYVLGCLDPGLCPYCPQPLPSSGREHPREITPALLSLLLLRYMPSTSVSPVLQRNKRFIKPL